MTDLSMHVLWPTSGEKFSCDNFPI